MVHVSPNGQSDANGYSWASAVDTPSTGVEIATKYACQVWVAVGTYPGRIVMQDGIDMFGGFAGHEDSPEQRDLTRHATVLDGQGAGPVVTGASARIDGFEITHGGFFREADSMQLSRRDLFEHGGGMLIDGEGRSRVSMTLANLAFHNNRAEVGGALYIRSADVTIRNVRFESNFTSDGPFRPNAARTDNSENGGAMALGDGASVEVIDSVFIGNHTANGRDTQDGDPGDPAGLLDGGHARSTIRTGGAGGAVHAFGAVRARFENCRFIANRSGDGGHGGRGGDGAETPTGSGQGGFGGNGGFAGAGGAVALIKGGTYEFVRCHFENNTAGHGGTCGDGGRGGGGPRPRLGGASGAYAGFGGNGGAIFATVVEVSISDSSFVNNRAGSSSPGCSAGTPGHMPGPATGFAGGPGSLGGFGGHGGAIFLGTYTPSSVRGCIFKNNSAGDSGRGGMGGAGGSGAQGGVGGRGGDGAPGGLGGAIFTYDAESIDLDTCVFEGNRFGKGGAGGEGGPGGQGANGPGPDGSVGLTGADGKGADICDFPEDGLNCLPFP